MVALCSWSTMQAMYSSSITNGCMNLAGEVIQRKYLGQTHPNKLQLAAFSKTMPLSADLVLASWYSVLLTRYICYMKCIMKLF